MGLLDYKLTDGAIAQKGVVAAADRLTGTAAQNKAVFDRLIRESVQGLFNGLIDALSGSGGAGEIGAAAIDGVTGSDVQTALRSLKTLLDTKEAASDAAAALALKSDKAVTDLHIKSISLNAETGVFTFTREDGSFFTIDTVLEKVATNWAFDQETQSLILTLADGTAQHVPLSAFITETEFDDSAQLTFSVENHRVTATVKEGSITDTMLSSALIAQMRSYVAASAQSAADAAQSAAAAEGYREAASRSAAAAEGYRDAASRSAAAAQTAAETAQGKAEDAQTAAEAAQTAAETAQDKAEDAQTASESAQAAAETAEGDAEAWAIGKRGGVDVPSTDPAYHNNSKYWADIAGSIVPDLQLVIVDGALCQIITTT